MENVGQLRLAVEGRKKNVGQAICTPWHHSDRLQNKSQQVLAFGDRKEEDKSQMIG